MFISLTNCIPANVKRLLANNNSSYHQLLTRKQYICSHMTEKLMTLMHVFYKFYEDKFADCDTGLLIKDGWNDQSWFLINGKSRSKKTQKHVKKLKLHLGTYTKKTYG